MLAEPVANIDHIAAEWGGRPVVAIVNLDVIAANVRALKDLIGPDCTLLTVVKANAYGFEAVPIAKAAVEAGAGALGVACVDEGIELRKAGIEVPILVFGAIGQHERARAITNRLSIVVTNAGFARGLATAARESLWKEPVSVHLKIDTGMRRFGAAPNEVVELAQTITSLPELRWGGIMTHHASADAPDPAFTHRQAEVFDQCLADLRAAGFTDLPTQHVANTATTIRFPEYHRDMVRCGIATHGLESDPDMPLPFPFRPATTIHARIARVFELMPGDLVGYGGTYSPDRSERAALVALGYADGYRRALSNTGYMAIRGQRADVIGRVSMDQCVIRVPEGLDIEAGEPVVVVGDGTNATLGAPTINELAVLSGGIAHDFIVGLAHRLPRLYVQGGEVVAVCDLAGFRPLI